MPDVIEDRPAPLLHCGTAEAPAIGISAAMSTPFVLNEVSDSVTGVDDGETDDCRNPFAVIDGDVTDGDQVHVIDVPNGANYLDIWHEWLGSDPTIRPKVLAFGATPSRDKAKWPSDIDVSYFNPGSTRGTVNWVPLLSFDNLREIEVPAAADDAIAIVTPTSKRSPHVSIFLRGASRVFVVICRASDPGDRGMIVGQFGR